MVLKKSSSGLVQLNEKKVATNREVHLLFLDLTKAYDTVLVEKLWRGLEHSPIDNTIISGSVPRVKVGQVFQRGLEQPKARQGDDQVVIAQDTEDLDFMARILFREYEY
ncbi:hypothetical protein HUJ04_010305 [Dendroctonus ponderosae]|nr:hypothetical protein HUJ04_010305 [Dendroctonus ponderosae]